MCASTHTQRQTLGFIFGVFTSCWPKRAAKKGLGATGAPQKTQDFCGICLSYEDNILSFSWNTRSSELFYSSFLFLTLWVSFPEPVDLKEKHFTSTASYPCLWARETQIKYSGEWAKCAVWLNRTTFCFPCAWDLALKVMLCFQVIFNQSPSKRKTPQLTARLFFFLLVSTEVSFYWSWNKLFLMMLAWVSNVWRCCMCGRWNLAENTLEIQGVSLTLYPALPIAVIATWPHIFKV